jgi:hypothetical protein
MARESNWLSGLKLASGWVVTAARRDDRDVDVLWLDFEPLGQASGPPVPVRLDRRRLEVARLPCPATDEELSDLVSLLMRLDPAWRPTVTRAEVRRQAASTGAARLSLFTADGAQVEVTTDPFRIGRSTSCELCIRSPELSRVHAVIQREGDGFTVADAGSANGTFLQRTKLTGPHRLRDGDVILMGATEKVRCQLQPGAASGASGAHVAVQAGHGQAMVSPLAMLSPLSALEKQERAEPEPVLEHLTRGWVLALPDGRQVPIRGPRFVVGSGPSCQLMLGWPGVLGEHLALVRSGNGYAAEQCSAQADVLVAGRLLGDDRKTLSVGDRLRVAGQDLLVTREGA